MRVTRSLILYPFSLLYGLITGVRNFLYNSGVLTSHEFRLPVICVGNITVGGTGKTPHTEYLISLLKEDFNVAILSRGYKRKSRGFRLAEPLSIVKDIGDEPLQMYRKFPEISVAVDRNRVHGINAILKEKPETEVIILDDAFQHRRIKPGFSILLSDFDRLIIKDHLLPYGNLRESIKNINRADIILITKCPENISPIQRRILVKEINKAPYQKLFFTSLKYAEPLRVFNSNNSGDVFSDVSQRKPMEIIMVTGIANPQPLKEHIQNKFGEIVHLDFHDHHNYTNNDIKRITSAWDNILSPSKYVFTTEKDAVRLMEFTNIAEPLRSSLYYIPIEISFLNNDKDEFDNMIVDYARKNRRNNRISES
jgi:tetraacyldisaccharide 4'-kinase